MPLSDEKVDAIALAYYKKRERKSEAQNNPRMVLVGGQSGAGKSKASSLVRQELGKQGGYIHIDADRMRERIPLDKTKPKPTSEQTQGDAGRLVSALRELAIANRRNFLEEGTFRNPENAERFVADKKAQGYTVEMLAVATPREQSLLGVYHRFEEQHINNEGNPRLVPEKHHDEAFQGFESTLAKVCGSLDRVRVIDRDGNVFFDSQAHQQGSAVQALKEGRELTDAKLKEIASGWEETRKMAEKRGAPTDYLDTLKTHHERVTTIQKSRIHHHALNQLDANAAILGKDQRYAQHTGRELLKAAYFRGFTEQASEFGGKAQNLAEYDASAADRQTLKKFPEVPDLEGRAVQRKQQRDADGHSL